MNDTEIMCFIDMTDSMAIDAGEVYDCLLEFAPSLMKEAFVESFGFNDTVRVALTNDKYEAFRQAMSVEIDLAKEEARGLL